MFYDRLEKMCQERGLRIGSLLDAIGVSRSSGTRWKKNGYVPSAGVAKKIADYFGVAVDEIMTGQIKRPPSETESGSSALWSAVLKSISGLTDEQLCRLLGYVERIKEEEREAALSAKQISTGA